MPFSKLVQKVKSEFVFYKGLVKDTEGASGIEYAIIAAMVAVVLAGFSSGVKTAISTTFTSIKAAL
ncbi:MULTISPECIES: Flp family type IVb pilin [unclassified Pseudomonas]|jgi:pilus assembly protein Flp/PilA|uniref:Flp family type IVb pilin n=1 Tax=unclassified Pseudomonas TaxID=196821 RepID=UPI0010328EAC|nr:MULTISPECIES: Flp family type IVb pilin [unclassified Pseudomonas]